MSPRSHLRLSIHRVQGDAISSRKDRVVVEEPCELQLFWTPDQEVGFSLAVTMRTPGHDFELAAGFLYSEGLIQRAKDIQKLRHCRGEQPGNRRWEEEDNVVQIHLSQEVSFDPARLQRHFYATSSCGVCGKASIEALQTVGWPALPEAQHSAVPRDRVHALAEQLLDAQQLFSQTGGLHAAGLFDVQGGLVVLREDVGRHNAMDKLIGHQLLAGHLPLSAHLAMLSGRTSFEMVQKALRAGIPILAAVGAPTSLAIELAEAGGLTLLGFVRDGRFNIYSHPQRIL